MKTNEENGTTNKEQIKKKRKAKTTGSHPDIGQGDVDIVDVIRAEVSMPQKYVKGPVPAENHYDTFKRVEAMIRARLKELPQDFYLTGLRVSYDVQDSSSEPDVLPYSVEFGPVELVDKVIRSADPVEISDDEFSKLSQNASIPFTLLDELYDSAKGDLEKAAAQDLNVGIYIILSGDNPQIYATACTCKLRGQAALPNYSKYALRVRRKEDGRYETRSYCHVGC